MSDLRARYERDGYVVVPGVLSPRRVTAIRAECDRLAAIDELVYQKIPGVPFRRDIDGNIAPDRIDPVTPHSDVIRELAHDASVRATVEMLLDDEPVLFKDKVHFKPPRTIGYGLHQDYATWAFMGVPPTDVTSMLIAVDPCTEENGAVEMFAGLHDRLHASPPGEPFDMDASEVDLGEGELLEMAPGDGLVVHPLAPHRSAANRSAASRTILLLTYNAARHGDLHRRYYRERHQAAAR